MDILLLGLGEIGSAIQHSLNNQPGLNISAWDKNASKIPGQFQLNEVASQADVIFICVPSWNLRGALLSIASDLKPSAEIIALAKGVERETHKTVEQVLVEILPYHGLGILGGPMIAEDILANKLAVGVLATQSKSLKSHVQQIFSHTNIRIHATTDVRGTALCGLLKNTYTLALGICDGLALGDNAKGALFSLALKEIRTIVKRLGGKSATVLGPAGTGDFYATSLSPNSRNRMVGLALSTGADGYLQSEGFVSLTCLQELIPDHDDLPLLKALIQISQHQASPELIAKLIRG